MKIRKGYKYSGSYSWSKTRAKARVNRARRKRGSTYMFAIQKARTKGPAKKIGYVLLYRKRKK